MHAGDREPNTDPGHLRYRESELQMPRDATMLRLLGYDHKRLTNRYAGRDFRLTDVHGRVVNVVLAKRRK